VETLDIPFTDSEDGRNRAATIAEYANADIIIWGSYRKDHNNAQLSLHFQVLQKSELLHLKSEEGQYIYAIVGGHDYSPHNSH